MRGLRATVVLSPALGGVVIGQEVGRALGVRAIFVERQEGQLSLRRGFSLGPSDRVLVVEDVMTTGGSTRETIEVAKAAGGQVVGTASIVDRSGGTIAVRRAVRVRCSKSPCPTYEPEACPLCAQGLAGRQARFETRWRFETLTRGRCPRSRSPSRTTAPTTSAGSGRPTACRSRGCSKRRLRDLDGRDVSVAGAGRTDAGVHALGQVAAFTIARELGPDALARALNARLAARRARRGRRQVAPPSFHPRFGAQTKTYRYQMWNGDVMSPFERRYAWHVPGPLDVEAMREAARLVEGRHDFAAFQATGGSVAHHRARGARNPQSNPTIRNPQSAMLTYEVVGTGFLRHMVRIIVGSLVEVGRRRQPIAWMGAAIASRDRAMAGPTAPARRPVSGSRRTTRGSLVSGS